MPPALKIFPAAVDTALTEAVQAAVKFPMNLEVLIQCFEAYAAVAGRDEPQGLLSAAIQLEVNGWGSDLAKEVKSCIAHGKLITTGQKEELISRYQHHMWSRCAQQAAVVILKDSKENRAYSMLAKAQIQTDQYDRASKTMELQERMNLKTTVVNTRLANEKAMSAHLRLCIDKGLDVEKEKAEDTAWKAAKHAEWCRKNAAPAYCETAIWPHNSASREAASQEAADAEEAEREKALERWRIREKALRDMIDRRPNAFNVCRVSYRGGLILRQEPNRAANKRKGAGGSAVLWHVGGVAILQEGELLMQTPGVEPVIIRAAKSSPEPAAAAVEPAGGGADAGNNYDDELNAAQVKVDAAKQAVEEVDADPAKKAVDEANKLDGKPTAADELAEAESELSAVQAKQGGAGGDADDKKEADAEAQDDAAAASGEGDGDNSAAELSAAQLKVDTAKQAVEDIKTDSAKEALDEANRADGKPTAADDLAASEAELLAVQTKQADAAEAAAQKGTGDEPAAEAAIVSSKLVMVDGDGNATMKLSSPNAAAGEIEVDIDAVGTGDMGAENPAAAAWLIQNLVKRRISEYEDPVDVGVSETWVHVTVLQKEHDRDDVLDPDSRILVKLGRDVTAALSMAALQASRLENLKEEDEEAGKCVVLMKDANNKADDLMAEKGAREKVYEDETMDYFKAALVDVLEIETDISEEELAAAAQKHFTEQDESGSRVISGWVLAKDADIGNFIVPL